MQTMVVFDFGGVLVRIEPSLAAACRAADLPVRVSLDAPSFRRRWEELDRGYQVGQIDTPEFFARIREALGGAYTSEELMRIHRRLLGDSYPGVEQLLADLHARGFTTGVLSNTNANHWSVLREEYPAFASLFSRSPQAVQGSHLLGVRKPERAVFRAYLERVQVTPSGLVFFDDSPENVEAAQRAGWSAFWVDSTGDTVSEMRRALGRLISAE